jgi:hypothetical protein
LTIAHAPDSQPQNRESSSKNRYRNQTKRGAQSNLELIVQISAPAFTKRIPETLEACWHRKPLRVLPYQAARKCYSKMMDDGVWSLSLGRGFSVLIVIECRKCRVARLMVHLSGLDNEYSADCPICGPVFGTVDFGRKAASKEPGAANATNEEETG